jgi:threonine dehydrogenase-like Zn-dependent dehydrogenase
VVVVGGGTVGLLVAHLADLSGGSVLVMELAPARRRIAARLGYELLDAADPVGHLLARTSAQLADFAVDAAATPSVAALLCSLVGPMSSIAVIGAYGNLAAVDLQAVMFKELTVLGSRTYLPTDLDAALTLLNEGQSKLGLLLSGVVNAEAVAATIQSLKAGEGMKYVVECPV